MIDVLWLAPTYPWQSEPVAGVFHQTQARALARLGVNVTVACPTPWAPWPMSRLRDRWRRYAEAPVHGVDDGVTIDRPRYLSLPGQPSAARPDRAMASAIWKEVRRGPRPTLVHGHSAVPGLATWRLAQRLELPYVLTFHGGDMNTWPDDHPERLDDLRSAVRGAHAVIAVSGALVDRIRDVTGVAAVHLPLGSNHREIARGMMPRAEARAALGLPDDRIVVLFVGYLIPRKGIRELVDALLEVGDPFLGVLVGDGPEMGFGTADPRAAGHVEYRGQLPHEEVVRYLSAADVFVLPARSEGLPTVLVEAGSVGLPIIATAVGGIPELLGPDRGTLLPSLSSDSIVAALRRFRTHRSEAEAAAARLRHVVHEDYDVDRNASTLLDLYHAATTR